MAAQEAAAPANRGEPVSQPSGLSALAAKILDQLSLSAWLPAALFAASIALLLQFREQDSAELNSAVTAIGDEWIAVLILAAPVLVLGTLTTQAFSFAAIRFLEGYWARRPARWFSKPGIRWQAHRLDTLNNKKREASSRAFDVAEHRYASLPTEVVMSLRAQAHELSPSRLSPEHLILLNAVDWRSACNAWDLAEFDRIRSAAAEYPNRSRLLPTRLGNILRATEDYVVKAGSEDLATFALRRRSRLTARAQAQHDHFRTRLDMYCTLSFVSFALALITIVLTLGRPGLCWSFAAIAAGYFTLTVVSYHAAISSARGYCVLLRLMAEPDMGPGKS